MSTRGMVGLIVDGEIKGHYNHSDSYPSWMAPRIAAQVGIINRSQARYLRLARNLRLVEEGDEPTPQEAKAWGQKPIEGRDWYSITREAQGNLLAFLRRGTMPDHSHFPQDSLSCEYAYVLDFDHRVLVLLCGFNKDRAREAPYAWCQREPEREREVDYWGCSLVACLPWPEVTAQAISAAYDRHPR